MLPIPDNTDISMLARFDNIVDRDNRATLGMLAGIWAWTGMPYEKRFAFMLVDHAGLAMIWEPAAVYSCQDGRPAIVPDGMRCYINPHDWPLPDHLAAGNGHCTALDRNAVGVQQAGPPAVCPGTEASK